MSVLKDLKAQGYNTDKAVKHSEGVFKIKPSDPENNAKNIAKTVTSMYH